MGWSTQTNIQNDRLVLALYKYFFTHLKAYILITSLASLSAQIEGHSPLSGKGELGSTEPDSLSLPVVYNVSFSGSHTTLPWRNPS
jgi:hypothetical protein